ncbi:hypothetical protein HPB47_003125, partial [Ixodes persulcatus]
VADELFAEFVHFVLSSEEILYDDTGGSQSRHLKRRCFRERLNPLEHFSDREVFCAVPLHEGDRSEHSAVCQKREYSRPAALTDAAAPRCFELLRCRDVLSCYGKHVNPTAPSAVAPTPSATVPPEGDAALTADNVALGTGKARQVELPDFAAVEAPKLGDETAAACDGTIPETARDALMEVLDASAVGPATKRTKEDVRADPDATSQEEPPSRVAPLRRRRLHINSSVFADDRKDAKPPPELACLGPLRASEFVCRTVRPWEPELEQQVCESLEVPISAREVEAGIDELSNSKTPGPDSLGAKFYKSFK